jgi:hypothetical protein
LLDKVERNKQRGEFVAYCCSEELFGKDKPVEHHQLLCSFLQKVEQGEIDRLMLFMPPGSAKSTYTSVRFASWYLGRHPGDSLIQACHTASGLEIVHMSAARSSPTASTTIGSTP